MKHTRDTVKKIVKKEVTHTGILIFADSEFRSVCVEAVAMFLKKFRQNASVCACVFSCHIFLPLKRVNWENSQA